MDRMTAHRRAPAGLLLALAFAATTGCLPFRGERTARQIIQSVNPFGLAPTAARDKIVVRSVLLERPTGDPYLATELWETTLKPLPPETAALLAENGLRVGTFPSNAPAELLERINAGDGTVRPHESTANLGEAKVLPVNGPVPHARFQIFDDIGAAPKSIEFENGQFGFAMTGMAADGGKLKLAFEPKAQHGQRQGWFRPTLDGTGFARHEQKELDRFPKLQFEVTVRPGEYLVIGPTERPADRAGGAWFVADANGGSRMRILVVRAWRGPSVPADPLPGRKPVPSE
jgi:hypothetical protein